MNIKINENLAVSVTKSVSEDIIIEFCIHFIKHKIKDNYLVKIKKLDTYILKKTTTPTSSEYYFYPINNHFLFFYKDNITEAHITALQKSLINKMISFAPKVMLSQKNYQNLTQCITEGIPYPAHVMSPIRNFSLDMDTIVLYQGDYLDNLSYHLMDDYMNRFDTNVALVSAYEINESRQKNLIENLENFQPKKETYCEIYFYAKVSFKDVAIQPPAPFYVGITFVTLQTFLNHRDNFISSLEEIETIYKLNNFFALKEYHYSKINNVITQIVNSWTEAIPAQYLAKRLANSFDVYLSHPQLIEK